MGKKHKEKEQQRAPLLDEILSLGGTKDDLTLLEDIDTDEEALGSLANDKELDNEVARFVKGLGIKKQWRDAVSDDERPSKKQKLEEAKEAESVVTAHASEGSKKAVNGARPAQTGVKSSRSHWLIPPTAPWYAVALPALPAASSKSTLKPEKKAKLRSRAESVLHKLGQQYGDALAPDATDHTAEVPLSRSDKVFLSNVLASGTSSDRLSALLLMTSSSPLHSTNYLGQLMTLCSKKSRDEALKALQSVSEWLRGSEGGLPDRKLKWFDDRDEELKRVATLSKDEDGDAWLAFWMFEDRLKQWYLDLIRVLETLSHDPLPFVRMRALSHSIALLSAKPEQEQNLLILASSLLADGDRSVASKASHLLLELLSEHSMMKAVVLREVAAIVLRPVADAKAAHGRYYGLITLNQMVLRQSEEDVANRLLDVYFKVFGDILTEQDAQQLGKGGKRQQQSQHDVEIESKLLTAVLTGVNRAFPYAELKDDSLRERLDTLYRIAHSGSFGVSLQALTLVHRLTIASSPVKAPSDRFYRTLYDSLIDSRLPHASKHAAYLNLVFRCLRADTSAARQLAFAKRLLQSLVHHEPPYVCGALRLLSELFVLKPSLRTCLSQPEGEADERFEDARDEADDETSIAEEEEDDSSKRPSSSVYDPRKRDPQHAGADRSCLWELLPLLSHYHPSVRLFASELLAGSSSTNTSDMEVYSLSAFVDRFAYREGKSKSKASDSATVFARSKKQMNSAAVNTSAFARKAVDKVPADQVFYHRFFSAKTALKDAAATHKRVDATSEASDADDFSMVDAEEDLQSELDEEEVWRAMKESAQGAPGFDDISDESDAEGFAQEEGEDAFSGSDEEDMALDALADTATAAVQDNSSGASDGELDLVADEADDVIGSDDEVPFDAHAIQAQQTSARTRDARRAKKRKLKDLPVFADADAWASLIDADG